MGTAVIDRHLQALRSHVELRDAEVYLGLQEFSEQTAADLRERYGIAGLTLMQGRHPPFFMRQRIVASAPTEADFWVFFDDDLFVTKRTRFDAMADLALHPSVGIVAGDYRRDAESYERAELVHRYRKSPILMLGGGMVFRRRLAAAITAGNQPYRFDDSQYCLNAYLAGYENYLYQGSLALHLIFPAGLRKSSNEIAFVSQDPRWITTRPNRAGFKLDNNYFITETKDLTAAAWAVHEVQARLIRRRAGGLL